MAAIEVTLQAEVSVGGDTVTLVTTDLAGFDLTPGQTMEIATSNVFSHGAYTEGFGNTELTIQSSSVDGNNTVITFTVNADQFQPSGVTIWIQQTGGGGGTEFTVRTVTNLENGATGTFLSGSSNVASSSGIDFGALSEGSGVLAVLGDGSIDFRAQATAIQLRNQGNFVYKSVDTAVILSVDAYQLNANLSSGASWSDNDDKWYPSGNDDNLVTVNANGTGTGADASDIDVAIKFSDIQSSVGSTQANAKITDSATSGIDTYFSNFVDDVKNNLLVDGGEVLFTDETLGQNTFTSADLLATIQYSSSSMTVVSSSGMDALGSGALSTDNPAATGTNEGSTAIQFESESLKILQVNKMLRRMMDIGYNNRDASSGSGTASGSGAYGYINDEPFIAGDIFYFPNGFTMDAQVSVDDEILADPRQRSATLGSGLSFVTGGTSIVESDSTHNIDLFIVLK